MWPGSAAVAAQHVARALGHDRPTAPGTRPGRGCPARALPGRPGRGPRRAARASRRRPRRRPPRPSAPSSSPVPTPKWMRGTPRSAERRRTPWRWRAARSARSRSGDSAPAQESNSWTALAPGLDLRAQRRDGQVGQAVEQRVPQRRVAVHQRLGAAVGPRRAALDQVAGHRERRAGEADERRAPSSPTRMRTVSSDVRACRPRARAGAAGRGRRRSGTARSTTGPDARGRCRRRSRSRRPARRCRSRGWRRRRRSAAPAGG